MKTRTKKFTTNTQPLNFELEGESFDCLPALSFRSHKNVSEGIENLDIDIIIEQITSFIVEDQRDKFVEMIESDSVFIAYDTLFKVWRWLVEEYEILKREVDTK